MDEGWSENLQRRHPHLWRDPKRLELRRNLLRFGGSEVFLAPQEPYLDMLVSERAIVWDGTASKRLRGGEPHRCHSNVAHRYERQMRRRWRIATGYALAGSLWVQHSWLCGGRSIGETTVQFMAYAGVVLDEVESIEFWCQNREKASSFVAEPPPGLRLDDPRVVEGLIRELTKRGISVRAALMRTLANFKTRTTSGKITRRTDAVGGGIAGTTPRRNKNGRRVGNHRMDFASARLLITVKVVGVCPIAAPTDPLTTSHPMSLQCPSGAQEGSSRCPAGGPPPKPDPCLLQVNPADYARRA
jgi:hypothetical protein